MLKEKIENNAKIKPNSDFINELRQHFPQFFRVRHAELDTESLEFDIEKFTNELAENNITEARDGYRLSFVGKDYARLQTGCASETMITPDKEHNSKPENANSQHVFITGDNLEALRHLQNAYKGLVKMIYIDPPYNTGKEFVYKDSFEFDDLKLKTALGYSDDEIARLKSIQGKSSHSAWLTFMYPRLKLAQKLLSDDGVIFVSIDDNEQANLKLLMDEVFNEGNFEATIIPIVNPGGRDYKQVAVTNEYLLIYSKSNDSEIYEIPKEAKFLFSDSKGGFNFRELRNRNPKFHSGNRPNLFYSFYVNPNNKTNEGYCEINIEKRDEFIIEVRPYNSEGKESVWRWGKIKVKENIFEGDLDKSQILAKQKKDGNWNIYEKCRISTTKVKSVWDETEMRTENGTREIRSLFGETVFDHPKPISLLKRCVQIGTNSNAIILDFFAGSATTAHAVMQLNAEEMMKGNDSNRTFIMVQLDEPTYETDKDGDPVDKNGHKIPKERNNILGRGIGKKDTPSSQEAFKAGYITIDEIARERIKRAAAQIDHNIDKGFKHYHLVTPTVETLDKITTFDPALPQEQDLFEDMVDKLGGIDSILQTWLIDDGYTFDQQSHEIDFEGYKAHHIDNSILYIIKAGWDRKQTENLLNRIGRNELNINTIIVFGYSFTMESLRELKQNVKNTLNRQVSIEIRY